MKIKNLWHSANALFRENLLLIIIVLGAGWWIFFCDDGPVIMESKNYARMEMEESAMDFARAPMMAKNTSFGRGGGGIMPPVFDGGFDPDQTDKKVIKNGNLTVEVEDTEVARESAEMIAKDLEGAVTNLNSWEVRPGILSYNMTLRIPAEMLEEAVKMLAALGVKKSEGFSVRDITAAYYDTEAQLENLEARRDRLRELMERKTENLGDVLQIDRELSSVQHQIENLERRQKGRDIDVGYSTLHLNLQPEPEIGDFTTPNWTPERSWKQAVNDLIGSLQGIFDKAISILVFAPIWVPILLLGWWINRRFFKK